MEQLPFARDCTRKARKPHAQNHNKRSTVTFEVRGLVVLESHAPKGSMEGGQLSIFAIRRMGSLSVHSSVNEVASIVGFSVGRKRHSTVNVGY